MKERSLVAFTLASQLAVGLFVLAGPGTDLPHSPLACIAVTPLALVGMLASFLHLGRPLNAWRAVSNLRTSWLSREILLAGLFTGLSGLYTLFAWFGWGTVLLRDIFAIFASLTGLALICSMARVYMLRSLSPWRTWLTLASFFATTFVLGILALAAFRVGAAGVNGFLPAWARAGALFCLAVQFLAALQWETAQAQPVRHLALRAAYQRKSAPLRPLRHIVSLRLGLEAAGVAIFLLAAPSSGGPLAALCLWLAFALALSGEFIGRALFYSILE